MANGLKTIEQSIQDAKKSLMQPANEVETAHHKALLNFLDGLSGQIKAFCFTWTGNDVFDDPIKKPE